MKYILPILLIAGVFALIVLSGCISNKTDPKVSDDDQITKSIDDLNNQNSLIQNNDDQISKDIEDLTIDDNTITTDPEIQEIENDLSELDALLKDDNPLEGLN